MTKAGADEDAGQSSAGPDGRDRVEHAGSQFQAAVQGVIVEPAPLTAAVEPDTERSHASAASAGAQGAGLTAMVVVMVLFIRIMAVSGWNWGTAAELTDAFNFDDAVPIFFGTLFELPMLTGVSAAVILPLACYRLYLARTSPNVTTKITDWLIIILLGIILFVLQRSYGLWWPILLTLGWGVAITVFVILVHKGVTLHLLNAISRRVGTLLVGVLFVLSVVVTTPWNPREEIGLKDQVITGHVIETSPGFLKVLTDEREVLVMLTGDVEYRKTVEIPE